MRRRSFLQALAAGTMTLPFARLVRGETGPGKRLVLLMQNNGTQQANFWPDANFSSPILDHLFKDQKTGLPNGLKQKTNLVKGVYVPNDANGTNSNQHDMGFARMFTGHKLISAGGQPWGGGPSVDQILAQKWKEDSLTLAVLASQTEPFPKPGYDHRESFSYLGPATIKHPRKDPLEVFNYLFPPPTPDVARRQSVLDAVAGNLGEISGRLGPAERAKLDYHLTAIRDVERRLKTPSMSCARRGSAPQDYKAKDPGALVNIDTYITAMVDDMIDLMVQALACGLTRITSLQFGYGGGKWRFAWEGIDMNTHDDVAHLDILDGGIFAENTKRVVRMNQYYARCVARLATALDAIPEGSGSLLDNTLIVWANELGRGDHSQENVPVVFIGKAGGAIKSFGRVLSSGRQVFNRLGCTVLNAMDSPVAGFGDAASCGTFPGLLS